MTIQTNRAVNAIVINSYPHNLSAPKYQSRFVPVSENQTDSRGIVHFSRRPIIDLTVRIGIGKSRIATWGRGGGLVVSIGYSSKTTFFYVDDVLLSQII